jgi:hypothetical protein
MRAGDIKPAMVETSGLALAVVAAEALRLLFVSDSSGLTFAGAHSGARLCGIDPEGATLKRLIVLAAPVTANPTR